MKSRLRSPLNNWLKQLPRPEKESQDAFEAALALRSAGREADLRLAAKRIVYDPDQMKPEKYAQLVQKSVDLHYGFTGPDWSRTQVVSVYVKAILRGFPLLYFDQFDKANPVIIRGCVELLGEVRTRSGSSEFHLESLSGHQVNSVQAQRSLNRNQCPLRRGYRDGARRSIQRELHPASEVIC